jgi:Tol biopolymer transport system component
MKSISLAVLFTVLCAVVSNAAADAAFPGRNGALLYGQSTEILGHSDDDGAYYRYAFTLELQTFDGRTTTLSGCDECDWWWYDAAASPDGTLIAFPEGAGLYFVRSTGQLHQEVSFGHHSPIQPAFSPDGRHVVFTSGNGIWIGPLTGGRPQRVSARARSPAWSTRNWIAFVRDGDIYRIRPDGHGLRRLVRDADLPTWSPDGTRLAFSRPRIHNGVRRHHGVYTSDAAGGRVRPLDGRGATGVVADIAWSPDGRRLLLSRGSDGLLVVDLRGDVRREIEMDGYDAATPMGVDWQPLPPR